MTDSKQLVHRIFDEIINQRRLDRVDELFADDYVDHGPTGDMQGREALRQMMGAYLDSFADLRCEVSNVIAEGDLVAWVVTTTGTHTGDGLGFPATQKRISTVSANMGRTRDGKAVEHWAEQGMLAMLQQLGVVPEMGAPQPAR